MLTLLGATLAASVRMTRAGMIQALRSDFAEMARLNGFPERRVVWRHALRNALAPAVQIFAQNLQYLIGGVIVVEYLFAYPGLGKELVDSVAIRDVRAVQSIALLIAVAVVTLNLIADLLVLLLVPEAADGGAMNRFRFARTPEGAVGVRAAGVRRAGGADRPVLRRPLALGVDRAPVRRPEPAALRWAPTGSGATRSRARSGAGAACSRWPASRRCSPYLVGAAIGLTAGYLQGLVDAVLMRGVDVLVGVPALLFILVLLTGAGTGNATLVAAVAIVQAPLIARVVRSATLEQSVRAFVEAAVARGETVRAILLREIVPNIVPSVMADAGLRLTYSIILVASVNFFGLGLQPPAADWALMISENRDGFDLNPWVIIAPAAMIALLTIAVNLIGDALARSLGRSDVRSGV